MSSTLFTDGVTLVPAVWLNDLDKVGYSTLSAVAGTNTITATGPTSLTAYSSGNSFEFTPAANNTSATTINITSLGAKNIFSNGAACVGGELVATVPVRIKYDGTQFNIVGTASFVKVGSFTRDLSTASGSQSITGVGFKPKAVVFLGSTAGGAQTCWGFDTVSNNNGVHYAGNIGADTFDIDTSNSLSFQEAVGKNNTAKISSMDADGFTVAWTRTGGTAATTATIMFLAFR